MKRRFNAWVGLRSRMTASALLPAAGLGSIRQIGRSAMLCCTPVFLLGIYFGLNVDRWSLTLPKVSAVSAATAWRITNGWKFRALWSLPESVSVIRADHANQQLYIGTRGQGGVHRVSPGSIGRFSLAEHLGAWVEHGHAEVSSLALIDLDGDRQPELVAQTSQVIPRDRPRLYLWDIQNVPKLRASVEPAIASSWSHGLGAISNWPGKGATIVSTHCGNGEIIEYTLLNGRTATGGHYETLTWQKMGNLKNSGESVRVGDVDNRGFADLCLAVGFAPGRAELRIYNAGGPMPAEADSPSTLWSTGRRWAIAHVIDEDHRFGNVRFVIGHVAGSPYREIIAFWCTEEAGGLCEIVRYRLDFAGIKERVVLGYGEARELWPTENQIALCDMDGNGNNEVWFATGSGYLWRHDGQADQNPELVAHIPDGIGPLEPLGRQTLYLGIGNQIYSLAPSHVAGASGP